MCLPALAWVATVFIGRGVAARILVGGAGLALFFGLYSGLRTVAPIRKLAPGPRPPSGAARRGVCRIHSQPGGWALFRGGLGQAAAWPAGAGSSLSKSNSTFAPCGS
jgi:uncharacterized iron-regulated membrane protein